MWVHNLSAGAKEMCVCVFVVGEALAWTFLLLRAMSRASFSRLTDLVIPWCPAGKGDVHNAWAAKSSTVESSTFKGRFDNKARKGWNLCDQCCTLICQDARGVTVTSES